MWLWRKSAPMRNDRRHIDASLNNILSYLESLYLAEIVDSKAEILNL